ncbi:MAG TPA: AmmeMemoRadiSam system protein A [Flavobacteriales bacterium]|nr:AmmeMemoRadiSam system protein A [Flavobacteriales bacterium]
MNTLDQVLLEIARLAIYEELTGQKLIDRDKYIEMYPELAKDQAVFVTINKVDGQRESLRGCIGSILPHRPLIDDVIYNAKAAAFNDPRFPPLKPSEFDDIKIEISLLSIPKKVDYKDIDELRQIMKPFKHGVILKLSGRQATFLPQVWEQIPDFDLFFVHLCEKAGLPGNCLDYHPEIYVYEVKKIEEA